MVIISRAEKEEGILFFFLRALYKQRKKKDNEDGFKTLKVFSLLWLGGEFVPFVVFGFCLKIKRSGVIEFCCDGLESLCGGIGTLGCVMVCTNKKLN